MENPAVGEQRLDMASKVMLQAHCSLTLLQAPWCRRLAAARLAAFISAAMRFLLRRISCGRQTWQCVQSSPFLQPFPFKEKKMQGKHRPLLCCSTMCNGNGPGYVSARCGTVAPTTGSARLGWKIGVLRGIGSDAAWPTNAPKLSSSSDSSSNSSPKLGQSIGSDAVGLTNAPRLSSSSDSSSNSSPKLGTLVSSDAAWTHKCTEALLFLRLLLELKPQAGADGHRL